MEENVSKKIIQLLSKRLAIISDLHFGHRAGLTPPAWQYPLDSGDSERIKFGRLQRVLWNWVMERIKAIGKIDILIVNGDAIDGKGERSGGTEQLEPDRMKQAIGAAECIRAFGADKIYMTYGTPYHGGVTEDFEAMTARELGAEIHSQLFLDVNGLVFDCKHKISGSIIPHGRHTAISRDALWNVLWSVQEGVQPNADVTVRSHVHYYAANDAWGKLNIITPALMGFGSKYGARQCSGIVNIGFVWFDITSKEEYTWHKELLQLRLLADTVVKA